ncbi:deubiquitinase OTUD6B-like [Pocillopora damicornis]|uniref:deubiquitinase OTUD6B-like n=1 Tax=Pocillopora damicornis TaxID=46731 RepID=UPI000F5555BB|nr:deubiquitinase OTUD6B-like [Pocillopora damicornis]
MAEEDEDSSLERVLQRHRKEAKDLQAKIQALKHSVPKGDKKKKKEMALEIAKLEEDLSVRHKNELDSLQSDSSKENHKELDVTKEMESISITSGEGETHSRVSKAQKRRVKMYYFIINVNPLTITFNSMQKFNLEFFIISLYNAIADQLSRRNQQTGMQTLRKLAADYMLSHQDDFLPFLTDAKTGKLYTPDQFVQYCEEIAATASWGGHLEIQALSQALKLPIEVYQANAPVLRIGEDYDDRPLLLSYHHHEYGLGEHYNSVIPTEECFDS